MLWLLSCVWFRQLTTEHLKHCCSTLVYAAPARLTVGQASVKHLNIMHQMYQATENCFIPFEPILIQVSMLPLTHAQSGCIFTFLPLPLPLPRPRPLPRPLPAPLFLPPLAFAAGFTALPPSSLTYTTKPKPVSYNTTRHV